MLIQPGVYYANKKITFLILGEGTNEFSDTSDKKPEPEIEIIEEINEDSKDTTDDAEKPSDEVSEDEHTEL